MIMTLGRAQQSVTFIINFFNWFEIRNPKRLRIRVRSCATFVTKFRARDDTKYVAWPKLSTG